MPHAEVALLILYLVQVALLLWIGAGFLPGPDLYGRGRDGPFGPPPAQIRTSGITASGSYLGYLASKRTFG